MTTMKTPSQVNENYACATHSSLPAGRFHPDKRVVVWRLHDTDAKFRTFVKFSVRCNNWGEITRV